MIACYQEQAGKDDWGTKTRVKSSTKWQRYKKDITSSQVKFKPIQYIQMGPLQIWPSEIHFTQAKQMKAIRFD